MRSIIKKIIFAFAGMLFSSAAIFGQSSDFPLTEVVQKFEKAVIAKDTSLLRNLIADNFAVSTTTWPASANLLQTIFNTKKFEYIRLVPEAPVSIGKDRRKVTAVIKEAGKEESETGIVLNQDNKILYVDYFDWLFGRNRYSESRLLARIPIQVDESGSITLLLRINNSPEKLRFLFDSGADGMAISRHWADSLGLNSNKDQQTSVVGGNVSVSISSGNTVYLDTLRLNNQNIAIFDRMRSGVDGLIGLNILKAYIAGFDLDECVLSLYNFGKYTYDEKGSTVDIIAPSGVPMVPGRIDLTGDRYVDGQFAFDTGASYYFIGFSSFVRKNKLLTSGFQPESQSTTTSLGKVTPVFTGKCADFKVGDFHLKNMPVSLQAGENWPSKADGSLGVRFISRYNFTINLLEKEIHLVENKRSELPLR